MVTLDVIRELFADLPGVEEGTSYSIPAFKVKKKLLARIHQKEDALVLKTDFDAREKLMQAMPQITLVLAIGMYAQKWHMGNLQKSTLTETVRNWRQYHEMTPVSVIPMPHPSWRNTGWLKKNQWFASELLPVLKADVKALVS